MTIYCFHLDGSSPVIEDVAQKNSNMESPWHGEGVVLLSQYIFHQLSYLIASFAVCCTCSVQLHNFSLSLLKYQWLIGYARRYVTWGGSSDTCICWLTAIQSNCMLEDSIDPRDLIMDSSYYSIMVLFHDRRLKWPKETQIVDRKLPNSELKCFWQISRWSRLQEDRCSRILGWVSLVCMYVLYIHIYIHTCLLSQLRLDLRDISACMLES